MAEQQNQDKLEESIVLHFLRQKKVRVYFYPPVDMDECVYNEQEINK